MPKCVAAWLCGLYDTDRSVVEATQNSLRLVFKANEKIQNIRPLYQRQILEYCTAAVQNETPTTLSDERTVSKDDAATKYSRLVSTCTALVGSLLSNLKEQDIAKYKDSYSELLGDKKIWELGLHEDPSIRRSVHRLLRICLESSPQFIEGILSIVSKVYLANGLNSDQTGSSYDYIQALSLLTSKYPTVWTEHYTSKTSVDRRLRQFLKMGSQMGPSSFWPSLVDLFKALPSAAKPHNGADAAELLGALHGGVSRKEEPRPNLEAAFGAYLDITEHLCQSLPPDDSEKVLKELILPIITQYLQPKQENSEWTVPSNSAKVVAKAISIPGMASVVRDVWPQYSQKVIDNIKTSAPEQSQNYKESQNSLVSQASKLATVQDIASSSESEGGLQSIFSDTCESVITAAVNVLKSRNGKPYGAAGVIKEILSHNSSLVFSNKAMEEKVATFVRDDIPSLMLSPSGPQLLDIVIALPDTSAFNPAWDASLNAVLAAEDSPTKATTLRSILTSPKIPKSVDLTRPELQEYIKSVGKSALDGSSEWKSFSDILLSSSHIMSPTTTDEILSAMTDSLTLAEKATRALQGFQEIVQSAPEMLKTYASSETGSGLLHSLVLASESPDDDVALKAAEVNASIQSLVGSGSDSRQAIFNVIQQNLRHASSESLSVETLFNMAKTLTESLQVDENASIDLEQVGGLFPRLHDWEAILSPYLDIPPVPGYHGLPLTVATSLVKPGTNTPVKPRSRDRDGYSPVFRILQYMAKLFGPREGLFRVDKLPQPENWQYVRNFIITSTLIAEDLSFPGTYSLWEPWSPNLNQFSQDMGLAYAANLIISLKPIQIDESPLWRWAFEVLSNTETDRSPRSFHMVDAAAFLVRKWSNRPGVREQLQVGILEDQLKILFRSDSELLLVLLSTGLTCMFRSFPPTWLRILYWKHCPCQIWSV